MKSKTINAWQTGIMLFILMFANKMLVLPSLLYEQAGLEAFVIPVLLFALEFGLLYVFYLLKNKYPDLSFSDLLTKHFGKIVTYIVYVLFMFYFLAKAVLLYNVTYVFFRTLIYKDSSNILFLFCFLPVINHMAICGVRVMGRTMQLFFPIILLTVLFCIGIGFLGINSSPLLFEADFSKIFLTTLKHLSSFGDIVFLFVIMDKIKIKKGEWKVIFSFAGFSMFLVSLITTVFILSYTYTSFMHPFAIFEIMSYVKEYSGLGRIDIISMMLIIVFTYFHLAIYMKCFMLSFDFVFQKPPYIYSVLTFDIAFVLSINYLVLNLSKAIIYGEEFLPYLSILSFVIVPLLCVILFCKERRRQ
ncbi:MAG: GerAB/ArcD/ProY family transporter [Candidatus Caccovivens sp.]